MNNIKSTEQNQEYTATEYFRQGNGIVTLCGSTRFFFEALEINKRLNFELWVVLSCGSWGHSFHKYSDANRNSNDYELVKTLHYHKILLSNCIVVVTDKSGYIGDSTKAEIEFAKWRNLPVFTFDGVNLMGVTSNKPPNEFIDNSLIEKFKQKNGTLGF